jgi:hypothetical protein
MMLQKQALRRVSLHSVAYRYRLAPTEGTGKRQFSKLLDMGEAARGWGDFQP